MVVPPSPSSSPSSSTPAAPAPRPRAAVSISISQRTLWLSAALVMAILVAILLVTEALGPIVLLLLSIIIGEAIRPVVDRLERHHVPPPLAVLAIYLVVFVSIGALLWLLLSPLISELSSLIHHLPAYEKALQQQVSGLQRRLATQGTIGQAIQNLESALESAVEHSAPALIALPFGFLTGIFGVLIDLVIVLTMTLFWLLSSRSLKRFVVGLFAPSSREHASGVISEISLAFGGYVRGTLISMVLIGLMSSAGLALLQVPYALLLGVLAGLTELLPYLGPWISGSVAVVLALITVGPWKAVQVVLLFVLIQELEGNLVQPLVMSRAVHIDPLVVIVAVLIGINLLGIIGAILAVPVAAGLQVMAVGVLAPAIRQVTAADPPAAVAEAPPEPTPSEGPDAPPVTPA